MSVISFSGPQGSGKTTVLSTLEKMGYNFIPQQTSRSILKEWGYDLATVNAYQPLTKRFQEEVIKRHYAAIKEYIDSPEIYLQDRSMADIFSYALNILGPFNQYSNFVNDYYNQCKDLQRNYLGVVYFHKLPNIEITDDGIRSTNSHFSTMIELVIENFVKEFDSGNVLYVETADRQKRIDIVVDYIEGLKNWNPPSPPHPSWQGT
jgi:predicted ATPase